MRRVSLVIFLVCLLTSSVYAANYTWTGAQGNWEDSTMWSNSTPPVAPGATNDEYKIGSVTAADVNIGVTAQTVYKGRLRVSGPNEFVGTSPVARIVPGADFEVGEFRVGDRGSSALGSVGYVYQTGGTISLKDLAIGRMASSGNTDVRGYYTISGDSVMNVSLSGAETGRLYVGGVTGNEGYNGGVGTFTIEGSGPVISMKRLYVGASTATRSGTGTLEYKLGSGVSAIDVNTDISLDLAGDNSVANLVVALTDEDVPPPIIVLVRNSGVAAVVGTFDSVSGDQNGGRAVENDIVVLSTPLGVQYTYHMSYVYNAEASQFNNGNDIALVPEPATVALLGLGALVAVRRPRKK